MRRTILVLASLAALLVLGAGAVFAQEGGQDESSDVSGAKVTADKAGNQRIQCTGVPCVASGNSDLVFERIGNGKKDRILLRGGSDQVRANTYRPHPGASRQAVAGTVGVRLGSYATYLVLRLLAGARG